MEYEFNVLATKGWSGIKDYSRFRIKFEKLPLGVVARPILHY